MDIAPLTVPKKLQAMFRLTVDCRPVNAVTKTISWPMPDINVELVDTKEANAFD